MFGLFSESDPTQVFTAMSPNDVRRLSKRMSKSELQLHACAYYVHVCADNITHTYLYDCDWLK